MASVRRRIGQLPKRGGARGLSAGPPGRVQGNDQSAASGSGHTSAGLSDSPNPPISRLHMDGPALLKRAPKMSDIRYGTDWDEWWEKPMGSR